MAFSHISEDNQRKMVDVSGKTPTARFAHARATVRLNAEIMTQLDGEELFSKKSPVFQTASIAGVMGAKKNAELIPFCPPIALEDCQIAIKAVDGDCVVIDCTTRGTDKTGVEMEALTGACISALTIYDMCKAMSKDMVIESVHLVAKTRGKSDYRRAAAVS